MFDPTENPYLTGERGPPAPRGVFNPTTVPLPPEEKESLLSKVSGAGLGSLHYIGGTLDKAFGARALRGLLGGKPQELASLIPFSDKLGITDEANRVSGEDLLKQWGALQGEGTKGEFEWRDLAGPALEIAMNPATYLTLGTGSSLTPTGQAAAKIGRLGARIGEDTASGLAAAQATGKLAPTMASRIAAGQSGLVGFGLPFSGSVAPVGTGPTAVKAAEWLGRQGNRLLYSGPGRALSSLFDYRVGGLASTAGQQAMRGAQQDIRAGEAAAREAFKKAGAPLEKAGTLDLAHELRDVVEGVHMGPPAAGLTESAQIMQEEVARRLSAAQGIGRSTKELTDSAVNYGPRQLTQAAQPTKGFGRTRDFPVNSPNDLQRLEMLKDVPGGSNAINRMLEDPALRRAYAPPMAPGAPAQYIGENFLNYGPSEAAELAALKALATPPIKGSAAALRMAELQGVAQKSKDLGNWVPKMDPKAGFHNSPLTDFATHGLRDARADAGANAIHDMLAATAEGAPGATTVSLIEALKKAGLTHNATDAAGNAIGAEATVLQKLVASGKLPAGSTVEDLANLHVPASVAADAGRWSSVGTAPESLQPLLGAVDTVTNLTKAGLTSLWPAFHTRNALTGLWQNFVIGAHDPRYGGPQAYLQPFKDANTLRTGGVVEGANKIPIYSHLATDEEATRAIAEGMFVHGTRVGRYGTQAGEAIGLGTQEAPGALVLPGTPAAAERGLSPAEMLQQAKEAIPTSKAEAWPLNVRGVGGRVDTELAPVRSGQQFAHTVDDTNRVAAHIALLRQGYSEAEAALKSKAAHYDYSHLTGFEREAMRRVFPFYNWTRQNLPFQLEQLLKEPGGATAGAIRVADSLRQGTGFVPEYVGQGLAVPLGQEEGGQQRFLTHFGLPFEDMANMLGTGAAPYRGTAENVLGMTNPLLIKGPLELATGRQFYSGRNLDDLYSPTSNQALDQLLMNSPLSRVYTTGRTLADERKGVGAKALQVLGPGKINDVDLDKARGLATRDLIEDALKGNANVKKFSELYVRPELAGLLSPEETQLVRLYKSMEKDRQAAGAAYRQNNIPVR